MLTRDSILRCLPFCGWLAIAPTTHADVQISGAFTATYSAPAVQLHLQITHDNGQGFFVSGVNIFRTTDGDCSPAVRGTAAPIPWTTGQTLDVTVSDATAQPGKLHRYVVRCVALVSGCGLDLAWETWGLPVDALAATSSLPVFLGHGTLNTGGGFTYFTPNCPTDCF